MKPKFPNNVNFNTYIENQKAFEKHKKKLDSIYNKLNPKSSMEFGFEKNYSFRLLEEKLRNTTYINHFYASQEKKFINKDNMVISRKLQEIENRRNIKYKDHGKHDFRSSELKTRLTNLKNIETDKIRKENGKIGKRLELRSTPTIKLKKIESDFTNNQYYRKNYNKFQLPDVIEKAPKILKRNLDTSPYIRSNSKINLSKNNYSCFSLNFPSRSIENLGFKSSTQFYDKKHSLNLNSNTHKGNNYFDDSERFKEIDEEIQELERRYGLDDL